MDNTSLLVNSSAEEHARMQLHPQIFIPYASFLGVSIVTGTIGNIFVIVVTILSKELHKVANALILNLALADLVITAMVDPFSFVGLIIGESFFSRRPTLCITVAAVCTTGCYCSLLSIGAVAVERYILICRYHLYKKTFTRRNVVLICVCLWLAAFALESPNFLGWGGHRFNQNAHGCYFDWEGSYSYACFLVFCAVCTPLIAISICYVLIFVHVRQVKMRTSVDVRGPASRSKNAPTALARTFLLIFIVFTACWLPFAVVMVTDPSRTFPLEAYLFPLAIAHSSSTWNPILYATTNRTFRNCYLKLFKCSRRSGQRFGDSGIAASQEHHVTMISVPDQTVVPSAVKISSLAPTSHNEATPKGSPSRMNKDLDPTGEVAWNTRF